MTPNVFIKLGIVFRTSADLIAIPCFDWPVDSVLFVRGYIREGLKENHIPLPPLSVPPGEVFMLPPLYAGAPWRFACYMGLTNSWKISSNIMRRIGMGLGQLARDHTDIIGSVAAPLLGSFTAMSEGFAEAAPDEASLILTVLDHRAYGQLVKSGATPLPTTRQLSKPFKEIPVESPATDARREGSEPPDANTSLDYRADEQLVKSSAASAPAIRPSSKPHEEILVESPAADALRGGSEPPNANTSGRGHVFISYCHRDKKWLTRLQVHLAPLERDGLVTRWDDTLLKPGTRWREEIRNALQSARVAVLLISADFLASDFVMTNELPQLLSAAEDAGTVILPVIIGPSQFRSMPQLSRFQAVNDPHKPLVRLSLGKQEEVFDRVASIVAETLGR